MDAVSGKPIGGALATMGNTIMQTDGSGVFQISGTGDRADIRAAGNLRSEIPASACTGSEAVIKLTPFQPKAL